VNDILEHSGDTPCGDFRRDENAILVIEDCEPLLFYLNSALLTLGFQEQHLAANLAEAEAVWALHKQEIRHVILNYELPDGIAFEFAARILENRPNTNIVITTGYDLNSIKESDQSSVRFQFLQKPFRLSELQQCLGIPLRTNLEIVCN
jgi:DNA-binding NtrC family response regulator